MSKKGGLSEEYRICAPVADAIMAMATKGLHLTLRTNSERGPALVIFAMEAMEKINQLPGVHGDNTPLFEDALRAVTPQQRLDLWELLQRGYCRECGQPKPNGPCNCQRDE